MEFGSLAIREMEGKDHQRLVLLQREKQIFQQGQNVEGKRQGENRTLGTRMVMK